MNADGTGRSVLVGACTLLLIMSLSATAQTTRYVWQNSPSPSYPYTSWNTAAHDIQSAVDVALLDDTILVTNSGADYILSSRINVTVGVTIRGVGDSQPAINGNNTVPCFYVNNPDAILDNLLIYGGRADAGAGLLGSGGGVTIGTLGGTLQNCAIENSFARWDGGGVFMNGSGTLRNCRLFSNTANRGGGVLCNEGGTLLGCEITYNTSSDYGGGAAVIFSGLLQDCDITYNRSEEIGYLGHHYAGGVYLSRGFSTMTGCRINNNYAETYGGGVLLEEYTQANQCQIEDNWCGASGGGVYFDNGGTVYASTLRGNAATGTFSSGGGAYINNSGLLESCAVAQNSAGLRGGGVYAVGGIVLNCLVQGNTAVDYSGGIDCQLGSVRGCTIVNNTSLHAGGIYITGTLVDSIIYDNTATSGDPSERNYYFDAYHVIEYCCLSPVASGTDNFDQYPYFVNPAAGNYRLMWNSPCINAATPSVPSSNERDADVKARMLRGRVDIGAYEFGCVNNDFDADGKTDIGIFRPSTVTWYVFQSTAGPMDPFQFGTFGDLPVPGDYDSDGHSDLAIFRPSTVTWYVFGSKVGPMAPFQFGTFGDLPAPADYDGDGQSDLAIYRPSTMTWYVFGSSAGPIEPFVFGAPGDIPVPADYDGDGKADLAVFRPSTVTWYRYGSTVGPMPAFQFGTFGDLPMPGDYDGDGQVDMAIFRPSTVTWYIFGTSAGPMPPFQFGTFGDRPLRPFQ